LNISAGLQDRVIQVNPFWDLTWYAEFYIEIDLQIRKTEIGKNLKINILSLHTSHGANPTKTNKCLKCKKHTLFTESLIQIFIC
jgi:hypothetical protein